MFRIEIFRGTCVSYNCDSPLPLNLRYISFMNIIKFVRPKAGLDYVVNYCRRVERSRWMDMDRDI